MVKIPTSSNSRSDSIMDSKEIDVGHEADSTEKFHSGTQVFGLYKMKDGNGQVDKRWYQAIVQRFDKKTRKFSIEWCEDKDHAQLALSEIKLPEDLLKPGLVVNIIRLGELNYDDVVLDQYREDGNHVFSSKVDRKPIPNTENIESLMVRATDLAIYERKQENHKRSSESVSDVGVKMIAKSKKPRSPQTTDTKNEDKSGSLGSQRKRTTNNSMWNVVEVFAKELSILPSHSKKIADSSASSSVHSEHIEADSNTPDETIATENYGLILREWTFMFSTGACNDASFHRKHLAEHIKQMGGNVVNIFEQLHSESGNKALLSPTWCRTTKYFQCLASGIPCISHEWILEMVLGRRFISFDDYRLPAGSSTPSESVIYWKPRSAKLLKGTSFGFYSVTEIDTVWKPILEAAKAEVVILTDSDFVRSDLNEKAGAKLDCDIVVLEDKFPKELISKCRKVDINVVITEWILETLVRGEKQPFLTHEQLDAAVEACATTKK